MDGEAERGLREATGKAVQHIPRGCTAELYGGLNIPAPCACVPRRGAWATEVTLGRVGVGGGAGLQATKQVHMSQTRAERSTCSG